MLVMLEGGEVLRCGCGWGKRAFVEEVTRAEFLRRDYFALSEYHT